MSGRNFLLMKDLRLASLFGLFYALPYFIHVSYVRIFDPDLPGGFGIQDISYRLNPLTYVFSYLTSFGSSFQKMGLALIGGALSFVVAFFLFFVVLRSVRVNKIMGVVVGLAFVCIMAIFQLFI